ncbi:MAG TPA: carbohydrate kinase family protein [Candidatus Wallbacteria bacterium]|nr:carbohydrate kinase family protein [Candidatus Wallbacteria bacterium]
MSKILVSGLINFETTLKIDRFPLEYFPVTYPFFGVNGTVSGVGYNVAKALKKLGDEVRLISMTGDDACGRIVPVELGAAGIACENVIKMLEHTPQSVIIFENSGRRQIHVDLKDIQRTQYPFDKFEAAAEKCDLMALCNINFSRRFLSAAKKMRKPIATDVHAISSLDDDYNRDFMEAADVLFMSDELLPCEPAEWARIVMSRFKSEVVVIGLGARGALIAVRSKDIMETIPACDIRPVVNTIGAGDSLFSAFIHFYAAAGDAYSSLKKAMVFAAWKIGGNGGADGFLNEAELLEIYEKKARIN